ncbi:glutaredoxin family protein [Motiliproteus coralliicola]|uniref:Glutaredoxin family protein n=1 Tax=Motiliproteus coralliicola TaxID=2283196 RepID=A0A369X0K8_9GAMM|nr:glutaredoxin family protein [Motiliproteus coralliicola]RDE25295.1 glutaredoxin family protein [Motiliproteus coralliicola]
MPRLVLYGTLGCHLCEVAESLLASELNPQQNPVEVVDIANEDRLVEHYGVRIPVLQDQLSGRELGWPFDAAQLQRFVASLQAQ